jgi:hypothetical protein
MERSCEAENEKEGNERVREENKYSEEKGINIQRHKEKRAEGYKESEKDRKHLDATNPFSVCVVLQSIMCRRHAAPPAQEPVTYFQQVTGCPWLFR